MLGGACLALARCGRSGGLGATGKAQPVDLSDHGVPRHVAEFGSDLAGRKPRLPEFLKLLDAFVGPGQYRHRILPLLGHGPHGPAAMPKSAKNPSTQNPLALAGREKRARTFTQDTRTQGVKTAARDVVPDKKNATIWRDSRARVRLARPHVPARKRCNVVFHRSGLSRALHSPKRCRPAALTPTRLGIECCDVPP